MCYNNYVVSTSQDMCYSIIACSGGKFCHIISTFSMRDIVHAIHECAYTHTH